MSRYKKFMVWVVWITSIAQVSAQKGFNDYLNIYPIGEDPNIRGMSSYTKTETILFEGNPNMRFSLYNNFVKRMADDTKRHSWAGYVSFRPQVRMYATNSNPVRMPSYRILLGTQHMFRLKSQKKHRSQFLGFSLESGHYSNGQDRCAFAPQFPDGCDECDSVYATINDDSDLSAMLNRSNGNFSTNLTEFIVGYRWMNLEDKRPDHTIGIDLGYVFYHDWMLGFLPFGGFTAEDIALYGRHRFLVGVEYSWAFCANGHKKKAWHQRLQFSANLEVIEGAHPHVEPIRFETMVSWSPFARSPAFGFFASYIFGHDNYNFRFVDSASLVSGGFKWDLFQPVKLKIGEPKKKPKKPKTDAGR